MRKLENREHTARFEHSAKLRQTRAIIDEIAETECDRNSVEAIVASGNSNASASMSCASRPRAAAFLFAETSIG